MYVLLVRALYGTPLPTAGFENCGTACRQDAAATVWASRQCPPGGNRTAMAWAKRQGQAAMQAQRYKGHRGVQAQASAWHHSPVV